MQTQGGIVTVSKVLRPWLWTVVWLFIFSLSYIFLLKVQATYLQQELSQLTRAGKSSVSDRSTETFIGVGDSLLAFSLPHEREFQDWLGDQVKWGMYWYPNSTWHYFSWIIDTSARDYDATTFILQESLFLNREMPSFVDRVHSAKNSVRENLKAENALKTSKTDIFNLNRPNGCNSRSNDKYAMEFIYKDQILTEDAKEFLHTLQALSKRVVVVTLPRAEMNKERLQNEWRKKLRSELEGQGIAFITLGSSMPDAYYCDGSHPNEIGREIRTAQMRKLILGDEASTP